MSYVNKCVMAGSCFKIAMLIAFIGSLNPWPLWELGQMYVLFSAFFLILAYICYPSILNFKNGVIHSVFVLFVLVFYQALVNDLNEKGFFYALLIWIIICFLLCSSDDLRKNTIVLISKFLAIISAGSLIGFVLFFFLGFNFPSTYSAYNNGQYEYVNYYLFLLDYRSFSDLIPRFNGIFLEPAHIGVACVMLLYAQFFSLSNKWYNIVLFVTVLFTFSLASYVLLFVGYLLKITIYERRNTILFVSLFLFVCVLIYIFSSIYNNGDNMFNELIIRRLQFDEYGNLIGDNRVSSDFKIDYENFLNTNDIWFGRIFDPYLYYGGNAGYRVYIYENGIVGLLLVVLFYLSCAFLYRWRVFLPLLILYSMIFWKGGIPLWFNLIIPYICALSIYSNNRV